MGPDTIYADLTQRQTGKAVGAINYVDIGVPRSNQTPYLLIHGLGASLHYWAGILPELSAHRRVVAIDMPGFGDSAADPATRDIKEIAERISELIRRLGLERACVVGHSMGGLVALLLAQRFPFASITLVDAHLLTSYEVLLEPRRALNHPKTAFGLLALLAGVAVPGRRYLVRLSAGSAMARRCLFGYLASNPSQLDPSLLREAFSRSSGRGIAKLLLSIRQIDIIKLMKDTDAKVTLVWGEDDPLLSMDDTEMAERLLHPEQSIAIPDCGHWPMLEHPDELTRIIEDSCG